MTYILHHILTIITGVKDKSEIKASEMQKYFKKFLLNKKELCVNMQICRVRLDCHMLNNNQY